MMGWFALFGTVTLQLQVLYYLLSLLPISFSTTTGRYRAVRISSPSSALAAISFLGDDRHRTGAAT
jgi:hypothetical protein